jgi:hypothetical protein
MRWKRSYSSMVELASASKFQGLKHFKKEGRTKFSGTLGRSYGFAEVKGLLIRDETWWMLVQWVLS